MATPSSDEEFEAAALALIERADALIVRARRLDWRITGILKFGPRWATKDVTVKICEPDQASECPDPRYAGPFSVLMRAFSQSTDGKGADRHGTPEPYEKQPTAIIGEIVGRGFHIGQAMKKLIEAERMEQRGDVEAANRERLGAINYISYGVCESERVAALKTS